MAVNLSWPQCVNLCIHQLTRWAQASISAFPLWMAFIHLLNCIYIHWISMNSKCIKIVIIWEVAHSIKHYSRWRCLLWIFKEEYPSIKDMTKAHCIYWYAFFIIEKKHPNTFVKTDYYLYTRPNYNVMTTIWDVSVPTNPNIYNIFWCLNSMYAPVINSNEVRYVGTAFHFLLLSVKDAQWWNGKCFSEIIFQTKIDMITNDLCRSRPTISMLDERHLCVP